MADDLIRQGIRGMQAGRLLPINFIAAARHNPSSSRIWRPKFFECFAGREKVRGQHDHPRGRVRLDG